MEVHFVLMLLYVKTDQFNNIRGAPTHAITNRQK